MRYLESCESITSDQLAGFFDGWPTAPSPETHLQLLRSSTHVVLAIDETDRVVGFVTAISDGVLSAYIPFLEVLPTHRGRGIGQELMRRMLDVLGDLYMVDLSCDVELQPFYASLGLSASTGMMLRRYEAQGGRLPPEPG